MKFVYKKFHRRTPSEELIKDVITVAKKLRRDTLTREEYLRHGNFHPCTLTLRFRSWFTVLKMAGLQPSRSPFDIEPELLFKNIEEVWRRLGKQPRATEMRDARWKSKYSYWPYMARFGSWTNALEKFIEYKKKERPGTVETGRRLKIPKSNKGLKSKKIKEISRVIPHELRFRVFLRDGFRCTCCGASPLTMKGVALHCDHVKPWSRGGKTVVRNLQTLCSACNLKKGSKLGANRNKLRPVDTRHKQDKSLTSFCEIFK